MFTLYKSRVFRFGRYPRDTEHTSGSIAFRMLRLFGLRLRLLSMGLPLEIRVT